MYTNSQERNVIFDLGGVVFDWNPSAIIERFLDELSMSGDRRDQLASTMRIDVFQHPDWLETDRGTLKAADAIQRAADRIDLPVAHLERLWDVCGDMMRPKPDTIQLMQDLAAQKIPLYILSNMPVERYAYLRQQHNFWPLFQGIVISGQIQLVKPDAAIYEHLLTKFNLEANHCAFLDDSKPNILTADNLGIHGIHFTSASSCRPVLERWLAHH